MKIFKSKKTAILITIIAILFFSLELSSDTLIKISPQIKVVINILLIFIVAIVNILSRDKSINEANSPLIKNVRVISIIVGIICFFGVFILKISGII